MTASFWIIIFAVLIYGGVHSWLASLGIKEVLQRLFGKAAERGYRLLYNLIAIVTLLPVLVLPVALVDESLYHISLPWMGLSVAGQIVAVLVLLAGVIQTGPLTFLGLCQLVGCEGETPPRLVVTGLYRWARHPLYSAGLVFIWLMPVMTWNLLALNLGITAYILVGAMFEERKLVAEFGQVYQEYRQRTPMLVPGLRFRAGK